LANDQTLSLDSTLADYLPELIGRIENADQITLRMMLQHRSGIPNFTDDPEFPWFDPPSELHDYLKFALDKPANFKPDPQYRYSNTNYLLIRNILDQRLGYSHHQFINEEILAPLGLTHTFNLLSEIDAIAELTKLIEKVKKEPHFINIKLHVDPKDRSNILLYEEWDDETYYNTAHMKTAHLQKFITDSRNFLSGPPEISFWKNESEFE